MKHNILWNHHSRNEEGRAAQLRALSTALPGSAAAEKYLLDCKNPFNQNFEEDPLPYEVDTEWIITLSFEIHVLEAI